MESMSRDTACMHILCRWLQLWGRSDQGPVEEFPHVQFFLAAFSAGDHKYEVAATKALARLWSMRSPLSLVGTSIDMYHVHWNDRVGGTGAGADSFYEYLLKAYVLFGKSDTDSQTCFTLFALKPVFIDMAGADSCMSPCSNLSLACWKVTLIPVPRCTHYFL